MFWDDEEHPSVLCPLGDFFGLGNEIVNSYDSILFSRLYTPKQPIQYRLRAQQLLADALQPQRKD